MTKKEMRKIFTEAYIKLDLFPIDIYFTTDKEKFTAMCEWVKADAITNVDGRTMLNQHEDGTAMIYIGVFTECMGTLAHECVHAANYVASAIGHELNYNDEIVPYITGYLFKECNKKMK